VRFAGSNRVLSRAQRFSLIAAIGVGLLSATGCSYINPQSTDQISSVADGVQTDLGSLQLRNIFIVSNGTDKPGRVLGAVYNTSGSDIRLTITDSGGSSADISVKANGQYLLNSSESPALLDSVGAAPGAMEKLTLSQDGTKGPQTQDFSVPVLNGALKEYQQYVPTPSPSSSPTSSSASTSGSSASATSTTLESAIPSATPSK
jgi:hypothetical protein